MKLIWCLLVSCLQLRGYSQEPYWQQQVNHVIDVTLNDLAHTLEGSETIKYINNSPDTLHFIWFHIWPDAFRNDQSAFSEQLLVNGRTDFYFSDKEQRGYINRLHFKINGTIARQEEHPQYIDIIKVILPSPLTPKSSIVITTPFFVKLPHNFSGGGHINQAYQVTQWYPKPAVYDHKGWHPMPYVDQGDPYNEYGDYDVRITLPGNYIVAATGELQNEDEIAWLKQRSASMQGFSKNDDETFPKGKKLSQKHAITDTGFPASSLHTKTLRFMQSNIQDFVWFADKRFIVETDSVMNHPTGIIRMYSYQLPGNAKEWTNNIQYIKNAINKRNEWLGPYPYRAISAVEVEAGTSKDYRGVISLRIARGSSPEQMLTRGVGVNWPSAGVSTNGGVHPWMHEAMNSFYNQRLHALSHDVPLQSTDRLRDASTYLLKRLPHNLKELAFETYAGLKQDQPMNTSAEMFSRENYTLVLQHKAAEWMKALEKFLGKDIFDSCMHAYCNHWRFKHPYPEDFKRLVEAISGKNTDSLFSLINEKGSLLPREKKSIAFTTLLNLKNTRNINYIALAPAVGANAYDGIMIGGLIHNFQLPLNKFRFVAIPLYATNSKKVNGIARASYSWYPDKRIHSIDVGVSASKFSINHFNAGNKKDLYPGFRKFVPFLKLTFANRDPRGQMEKYVQLKSYFIGEDALRFSEVIVGTDTTEEISVLRQKRNVNQLKYVMEDFRVLYPYRVELQMEQHMDFFRAAFTGNYFFNYANRRDGLGVRIFAGRFLYSSRASAAKKFETERYHLNLTGANGFEDYTYSAYFAGRNSFLRWPSQQIMIRDGAFKVRSDQLSSKIGKTDKWLIAGNLSTAVPAQLNPLQILPFHVPLKLFADFGTYAEAWNKNRETGRFLFDAGFQLSLFRESINVYFPVLYSAVFRDYFRSTLGKNRFLKTISFTINFPHLPLRTFVRTKML